MTPCPDCGEKFWNSNGHRKRCRKCAYEWAKKSTLERYHKRKEAE